MKRDEGGFRAEVPVFVGWQEDVDIPPIDERQVGTGNIVFYVELEPTAGRPLDVADPATSC